MAEELSNDVTKNESQTSKRPGVGERVLSFLVRKRILFEREEGHDLKQILKEKSGQAEHERKTKETLARLKNKPKPWEK